MRTPDGLQPTPAEPCARLVASLSLAFRSLAGGCGSSAARGARSVTSTALLPEEAVDLGLKRRRRMGSGVVLPLRLVEDERHPAVMELMRPPRKDLSTFASSYAREIRKGVVRISRRLI